MKLPNLYPAECLGPFRPDSQSYASAVGTYLRLNKTRSRNRLHLKLKDGLCSTSCRPDSARNRPQRQNASVNFAKLPQFVPAARYLGGTLFKDFLPFLSEGVIWCQ